MEQIYAKILLPNEDYDSSKIKSVTQDPLYKEFIEFKEEMTRKLGEALEQERKEDDADYMF